MIIYKITNNINGKLYVGQTIRTLKERYMSYKQEYKWDKRDRPILRAMRKYGIDNFTWEIIDTADTKEELDKKERFWIKELNTLVPNGYNVELGGNSVGKHSEETKRKISESQLGEKNHMFGKTGNENGASKKVIDLTTGKIYESANLLCKEQNLNPSHICAVARGERGSHKGVVIRYLDEENNIIQPEKIAKIKTRNVFDKILPEFKHLVM